MFMKQTHKRPFINFISMLLHCYYIVHLKEYNLYILFESVSKVFSQKPPYLFYYWFQTYTKNC